MYNETYEEYIRNILGYQNNNIKNNNDSIYEQFDVKDNVENNNLNEINYNSNKELEDAYPEIYKLVYPMIKKKCIMINGSIRCEDIEIMTDEIYNAIEETAEINIHEKENRNNRNNYRKLENCNTQNNRSKPINQGLRDIIKILLIRELLGKPLNPPRPPAPRPPFPPPKPPIMPRDI